MRPISLYEANGQHVYEKSPLQISDPYTLVFSTIAAIVVCLGSLAHRAFLLTAKTISSKEDLNPSTPSSTGFGKPLAHYSSKPGVQQPTTYGGPILWTIFGTTA